MTHCTKIPYPSLPAARWALPRIQQSCSRRGHKVPQGAYPCSACGAWHLTSGPVKKAWR